MIRTLWVTRASAVKACTQAFNTLWGAVIGAPSPSGPPAPETAGRTSSVLTCAESSCVRSAPSSISRAVHDGRTPQDSQD